MENPFVVIALLTLPVFFLNLLVAKERLDEPQKAASRPGGGSDVRAAGRDGDAGAGALSSNTRDSRVEGGVYL